MTDAELLHQLLYRALVEIRGSSREANDKVSYHLADLFHNIALEMGDAAQGGRTCSDVLGSLRERSESKECARWLDERLQEIQKRSEQKSEVAPESKLAG